MINEIQINSPIATYQNAVRLIDLRRINYIFGANGTGKTTISRVIAGDQRYEHCQLVWQGSIELERMVYNRDFVDRNFNQDGPLQGIFTLGENQVEAEREINRIRPEIDKVDGQISSLKTQLDGEDAQSGKRQELSDLEPLLRDKCWKQKQLHDDYFQAAFTGVRSSAERFKEKVLLEQISNTAELLSLEKLKEKAKTVFANDLERVEPIQSLSASELVIVEENGLLQKVIVGNPDVDIAALINRLGNSDWVKQGRQYHQQEPDICPFCQQSTDKQLADDLTAFFSEEYDNDIQALRQLQVSYGNACETLLVSIQRCIDTRNPFLKLDLFNAEAQALSERLKSNQAILSKKIDEPSRKVKLESTKQFVTLLQSLLAEASEATKEHNQVVANIATEKRTLIGQIWRYVLNELSDDLQQYQQSKSRLERTIGGLEVWRFGGLEVWRKVYERKVSFNVD